MHMHILVWPARPLSSSPHYYRIMNRRVGEGIAGQTNALIHSLTHVHIYLLTNYSASFMKKLPLGL